VNKYQELESLHCGLQLLQQDYNVPDDDENLLELFRFIEDTREPYLKTLDLIKKVTA